MHRLTIILIACGMFLTGSAELVVAGILNEIAADLHISIAVAGQFITAYSLAFAVGTPLLVALTARMGRRTVLVCSLAVFIVGCLASFASSQYLLLLVSRLVLGVSAGVYSVVAMSSVARLVPPEKMGGAISTIAFAFGSALTLGVPIGIAITDWWNWRAAFTALGLASLLIMLGLIRLLPQVEGDAQVSLGKQFHVLGSPVIISGFFLSFFLCASNSFMLTYLTPYFKTILHLNTANIGVMMFVLGVFSMIGSRLGGLAVDKWGTVRTLSFTLLFSTLSLAVLPLFTATLIVGLTLIAMWMCSLFATAPALQTYFIQLAPQSVNFVLGFNTSVIHLGTAVGAAAGGMLVHATSTVLYHPWLASCMYLLGFCAAMASAQLRGKRKGGAS